MRPVRRVKAMMPRLTNITTHTTMMPMLAIGKNTAMRV